MKLLEKKGSCHGSVQPDQANRLLEWEIEASRHLRVASRYQNGPTGATGQRSVQM